MATADRNDPTPRFPALAPSLIRHELFALSLDQALQEASEDDSRKVLDELIVVETVHLAFWNPVYNLRVTFTAP